MATKWSARNAGTILCSCFLCAHPVLMPTPCRPSCLDMCTFYGIIIREFSMVSWWWKYRPYDIKPFVCPVTCLDWEPDKDFWSRVGCFRLCIHFLCKSFISYSNFGSEMAELIVNCCHYQIGWSLASFLGRLYTYMIWETGPEGHSWSWFWMGGWWLNNRKRDIYKKYQFDLGNRLILSLHVNLFKTP